VRIRVTLFNRRLPVSAQQARREARLPSRACRACVPVLIHPVHAVPLPGPTPKFEPDHTANRPMTFPEARSRATRTSTRSESVLRTRSQGASSHHSSGRAGSSAAHRARHRRRPTDCFRPQMAAKDVLHRSGPRVESGTRSARH
jgi:hypothetical protein